MDAIVKLENIQHAFGKEIVLQQINLDIPPGKIYGLLGPSGSGKTTMVKIAVGIIPPTKGRVIVNGVKMPSLEQLKHIGYMAQSDALYNELTAYENLDFFGQIYGLTARERKAHIERVMDIVDLQAHVYKPVELYSGGMRRRLSLAAAMLHQPVLLILDEPTVGIDPVLRRSIWHELEKIKQQGTTILVTTHVMDEADRCDRLALLRDGTIIAKGSPDDMKQDSQTTSIEEAFLYYGGAKQ